MKWAWSRARTTRACRIQGNGMFGVCEPLREPCGSGLCGVRCMDSLELLVALLACPVDGRALRSHLGFRVGNELLTGRIVTHESKLGFCEPVSCGPVLVVASWSSHARYVVRAEPRGSGTAVQDKLSSLLRGWDKLAALALADEVLNWLSKLDWLEVLGHA